MKRLKTRAVNILVVLCLLTTVTISVQAEQQKLAETETALQAEREVSAGWQARDTQWQEVQSALQKQLEDGKSEWGRQLAALSVIHRLVKKESQFIIATHSPIFLPIRMPGS